MHAYVKGSMENEPCILYGLRVLFDVCIFLFLLIFGEKL